MRAIEALGAHQAESPARPVELKGTVIFVTSKGDSIKVHDGERSIGVDLPDSERGHKLGDVVEVAGTTSELNVQGHYYAHVKASIIRRIGAGALPAPMKSSMDDIVDFKHYNQWVSAEGTVLMWTFRPSKLSLVIGGTKQWGVVHVLGVKSQDLPRLLHAARVRFTGVNMGISHSQADTMMVPSLAELEIIKPGTDDIFAAPAKSVAEVVKHEVTPGERIKMKATVTAVVDNTVVYLRSDNAALCAQIMEGWIHSSASSAIYGDAGRLPDLKAGDEIEAVGTINDPNLKGRLSGFPLLWCHVRVLREGAPPAPHETTLRAVLNGAWTHDLVRLRGRLLHLNEVPAARGEWRTSMLVEADGVELPVTYQGKGSHTLSSLKMDDEVQITALVDNATSYDPRQLWLVSPSDVHSLGLAPAVSQRRLWLWSSMAVLVASILGAWVYALRRSLARQAIADASVRESNNTLERRVAERTTELEQAQSELRRSLDHERELGELKSRFVTMVSHEFRTPLGIIMSAVELMRHYEERLPTERRRELCDDIHTSTRLMAGLMEQVLLLGRVEAGKLGCRLAPLDIDTLAGKLTDESLSATNRRCPIHWRPEGSLEGARADEALLRHIISNLITNAVKYSPEGQSVDFIGRRDGTDAVFQIIDHGIGIPDDDQAHLFEAFYRCSNVGEIPGTGLGLVIVKRCVELHGGTLLIDSEVGRGTTFTVRLPLFANNHAAAATA